MITAWRIVKARHAVTAFDGEGARLAGGRWNAPGSAMIYTADSAALAALQLLVHLGQSSILSSFVLIACTFHESMVTVLDRARLPADWHSFPAPPALPRIGEDWLRNGSSAVLAVPSAVIETGVNYLLNPVHEDFGTILVDEPRPFEFDPRLRRPIAMP